MAFIITPQGLKEQGEFYYQLATMTAAGIPLMQAAESIRRNPPNFKLQRVAETLISGMAQGATFTDAMRMTGKHLPEFDLALIEAGEASGRLDQCFRLLANYYEEKARLVSMVLSQLAYPAFMFHFALLIFPTGLLSAAVWQGQWGAFFLQKLTVLAPVYAVIWIGIVMFQSRRSHGFRAKLETAIHYVPLIGKARQDIAMARLSAALEALLNAGVLVIPAWDIAARASGSPRIERAVNEARPRLMAGETPAEVIQRQGIYPDLFTSSYHSGEISGRLDETLRRMHQLYSESASRRLKQLADWMPKLIYIAVLIAIAFQIVSFWTNYYGDALKQLDSISQ